MDILKQLAEEFKIRNTQVENTVKLIDDGNTIPFISRYRKEMTGGLDDQLLRELSERLTYLRNLESRKEEVKSLIESGGNLTDKIVQDLLNAKTLAEVEDIYRPFKPKRKTRAGIAKEKGLQPLSDFILAQTLASPTAEAEKYISEEKGVETVDDAINGALDIISETVSDDADLRKKLYTEYTGHALIVSKATDEKAETVYKNYYDYSELACKIPPHRLLALDRGEREDALKVSIEPEEQYVMKHIYRAYVKAENDCGRLVRSACDDSFKRLIHPSLERRLRNELTEKACDSSIHTFSDNLRQLLMQPPVKNSVALGFDPGYRTGCKVAVVDATGKVLDTSVVYPTPPKSDIAGAERIIKNLIEKIRNAGDVAIRSTFIVGFPGETDEQFQKLYDFIGEYKLNYAGFFAYSKEDGTAAAKLKNQIPQAVKNKRLKNITALQSKVIFENNKNYVGKSLKVLYEGIDYDNNIFYGRPEFCAPEVDAKVLFSSDYLVNVGNFYDVKITGANGYDLVGEVK